MPAARAITASGTSVGAGQVTVEMEESEGAHGTWSVTDAGKST